MGRPPKQRPIEVLEEPSFQGAQEFEIEQFFQEVAPSVSVIHFHRMYPDGRRPQIGKAMLDIIREDVYEYVRTTYVPKYGGGKYMLIARGDGSRYLGSRMIEVEGDEKPQSQPVANGNGFSGLPADIPFHDKLLLYSMFKPQQSQLDIGAMMAGIAAMMTAMRPPEGAKPPDPIQMFTVMKDIFQGMKDKNEKSPLDQIRDVAGVIKEFSSDSKGIDGPWDVVASVGKEAIDKLAPVLTGVMGVKPTAVSPSAVQPRPAVGPGSGALVPPGSSPVPSPEQPAANPQDNLRAWLQSQVAFLKQKALAGKDPGFWVDYTFENAEEPGCQAMMYAIRQGATFDHLLAFDPEIGQNPTLNFWFREVYDGIRAGLQGDVDSAGPARDGSNDLRDGTTGQTGQPGTRNNGTGQSVSEPRPH